MGSDPAAPLLLVDGGGEDAISARIVVLINSTIRSSVNGGGGSGPAPCMCVPATAPAMEVDVVVVGGTDDPDDISMISRLLILHWLDQPGYSTESSRLAVGTEQ